MAKRVTPVLYANYLRMKRGVCLRQGAGRHWRGCGPALAGVRAALTGRAVEPGLQGGAGGFRCGAGGQPGWLADLAAGTYGGRRSDYARRASSRLAVRRKRRALAAFARSIASRELGISKP